MYGKFFSSAFTGSMMAAGAEVFAVWGYVIANTVDSRVELNPRLLAAMIGSTEDRMVAAIDYLCAPDERSRSKNDDGRRLIREGEYQYLVPNHSKYRSIRDEEGRREYNRVKQQEHRAKQKDVKQSVNDSQQMSSVSAHTETETETSKPRSTAEASATRLPADWTPTTNDLEFIQNNRPDLDVRQTADRFRDYWCAVGGQKGRKLNWSATWRNWVRNESGARKNGRADRVADTIGQLTGAGRQDRDAGVIDGTARRVD